MVNIELEGGKKDQKHWAFWQIVLEINKLCVNKPSQSMKQKAFAKINCKKTTKKALHKQTALDKAASSITYSITYNSIKIGRQSCLINLTLLIHINAFLRKTINKAITRPSHAHMYSDRHGLGFT